MIDFDINNDYNQITENFLINRLCLLGGGTYGKVYRGYDVKNNQHIAIKLINRQSLNTMNGLEQREIEIMKRLSNPNIMAYYGCHNGTDGLYLFLELCQKGTLKDMIQKNMSKAEAFNYFKQLVNGMDYINSQKIFHRDIKPQNLLITRKNELKIADFGIARQFADVGLTSKRCTPIYAAPQVYMPYNYNNSYSANCDVFSAGYILYEMLTGEKLTKGIRSENDLMNFLSTNRKKGGIEFKHEALTPQWKSILQQMMDFEPERRPSFSYFKQKLEKFKLTTESVENIGIRDIPLEQKVQSELILKRFDNIINLALRRCKYLTNVVKIFSRYPQKSQLVPRLYKLVLIYFSLFNNLHSTEQGINSLNKKNISLEGYQPEQSNLQALQDRMTSEDQLTLKKIIDQTAVSMNKSLEELRGFMRKAIAPELLSILNSANQTNEKKFLLEMKIKKGLEEDLPKGEYQSQVVYRGGYMRCLKNLFQTTAMLNILPDSDLKIYLTLLYVGHIDRFIKFGAEKCDDFLPELSQIQKMDANTLKQRIVELREFN